MSQRREPTLTDVAQAAGVSPTTVSSVLNNRGYLSEATKLRVAQAIEELGYRPNQVARALHGKSTQTVGVFGPTVALPFFGELAAELEDALAERGYRILVCNSMGRADREREYLDLLVSHRVDGIISAGHNEDRVDYQHIRMPLVTVDRDLSPTVTNVRCDNLDAGRTATRHLLGRGATAPALLTSRSGPHNLREAGYREVLADAGIEPVVLTVDFHTPDRQRARLISSQLDGVRDRIDAVFATDDLSAAAVLDWAKGRGLEVPEAFKVVGFDGAAALRRALPGLTTVRQPIAQLARTAASRLVALMAAQAAGREPLACPPTIELPGELLPGQTS